MKNIGNIDIKELATEYRTPLYVYDQERIEANYRRLIDAFRSHYSKTRVFYSVKSNTNLEILRIFKDLGAGADCSSPTEKFLASKVGFSDEEILYTGNYEATEDFEKLSKTKVRINLDDMSSFHRLKSVFTPDIISFRINPGIGKGGFEGITTAGTDAKFGVPYEKAYDAYKAAKDAGIERFGIHMMTGSNNLEPYYFYQVVDKLMMIAGNIFSKLGIKPEYIDIGGGLGVPYHDEDESLDIHQTAKLVTEVFREKCKKYDFGEPTLVMEPGRYLTADAGYLISRVTGVKKSYKTFIGLDAGMSTLLRPALYGAFHRVHVYGKDTLEENVNICGQVCENSDIFAKNIFMPVCEEGDLIVFRDVGAYGYAMASNYNNRLRPAEVLVNAGASRLIRRRETAEDLLSLYP